MLSTLANVDEQTALHQAAHHGKLNSCQVLINRGANALLRDSSGKTAAQISESRNFNQVSSYLIVVETCIRLANQVVTLRENLHRSEQRNQSLVNLLYKDRMQENNNSLSSSGVDERGVCSRKSSREKADNLNSNCVNVSFRSEPPPTNSSNFKDKLEQVSEQLLNSSIL